MRETPIEQTVPDEINDQYDEYCRTLELRQLNLKQIIRFDTTEMDDLCALLHDTSLSLL